MKNKFKWLGIAAVALVLVASLGSAMSYFTTYAEARGGHILNMETQIEEEVYDWTKHIVITSAENSLPVYVRAKAFAPDYLTLVYSGTNWTLGDDGFYYYGPVLQNGSQTEELLVQINDIPADVKEGDDFNVVVVYECTRATDLDGEVIEPNWNIALSYEWEESDSQ